MDCTGSRGARRSHEQPLGGTFGPSHSRTILGPQPLPNTQAAQGWGEAASTHRACRRRGAAPSSHAARLLGRPRNLLISARGPLLGGCGAGRVSARWGGGRGRRAYPGLREGLGTLPPRRSEAVCARRARETPPCACTPGQVGCIVNATQPSHSSSPPTVAGTRQGCGLGWHMYAVTACGAWQRAWAQCA